MQQVNLYLEEFKEKRVPFSAETWVFFTFGTLMFCFIATVVVFIMYVSSAEHISHAKKALADSTLAFEQAQQEYKIIEIDARLLSRIESMKKRRSQNKQLLKYLTKRNIHRSQQSFAAMLTALTRIQEPGLWLTEVQFDQAGDGLSLTGFAQNPESVPSYIKKLGKKEAFAGMQFKVFDLKRQQGQLAFTLSSQRQENEINEALMEVLGEAVQPTEAQ